MTNQTPDKQNAVEESWIEELEKLKSKHIMERGGLTWEELKLFLSLTIKQQKLQELRELLKELPKEKLKVYSPLIDREITMSEGDDGFNQCLSEIKSLIENRIKKLI